jgi:hypothetical protein
MIRLGCLSRKKSNKARQLPVGKDPIVSIELIQDLPSDKESQLADLAEGGSRQIAREARTGPLAQAGEKAKRCRQVRRLPEGLPWRTGHDVPEPSQSNRKRNRRSWAHEVLEAS